MTKDKLNTSLNSSAYKSRLSNTGLTVISALSKLKQEEQMVLREHKRHKVLNYHTSRQNILQMNKQKQQMFFVSARQSAQQDKQMKKANEQKKIEQMKHRYSINLKNRQSNRKMIQSVKKSFQQVNHELYEQIRTKKIENEKTVHMKRSFYLQSRVDNRKKASQQRSMRRKSIQNFYNSKAQEERMRKEEQIKEMLRMSQERHRFYQALSSRNSRLKENKLSMSRSLSNSSLKNPEKQTIQS